MEPKSGLVIFARLPVPGKVKTRLAASVGNVAACTFYRAAAENALREAVKVPCADVHLFYSDEADQDGIAQWVSSMGLQNLQFEQQLQESDLGARMSAAFKSILDRGMEKAIIIGTDVPDIESTTVEAAFDALNHNDVVLGPAVDGGYYLIGLRKLHEKFLQGIKWSTPEVFSATVSSASSLGMTVAPKETLPILQDIDELKDLQAWMKACSTKSHPVYPVARDIIENF